MLWVHLSVTESRAVAGKIQKIRKCLRKQKDRACQRHRGANRKGQSEHNLNKVNEMVVLGNNPKYKINSHVSLVI